MFKTPSDIQKYTIPQILDLVEDTDPRVKVSKTKRLKIIQIIYSVLGYDLSPDLALALLCENRAELILATAGGGKTTTSQIKILLEKIFRVNNAGRPLSGNKMLCLVYNKHNVQQMRDKQDELVTKIYSRGVTGISIDREVNCATMHSFCETWKNQYISEIGLMNYRLLSELEINNMFKLIIDANVKKYNIAPSKISPSSLIGLYNYLKESLIPFSEMKSTYKYEEVKLPVDFITDVFNAYDRMKETKRSYDFTDMLVKLLNLLKTNDEIREFIQNYYDFITADEIQDFTPIMMEILQLVVGDKVPLLCIGDEDQSIYDFRGADIYNTLDFENKFNDSVVLSLGANRRCGEKIIQASKYIVETNTLRYPKNIFGVNPGGSIDYIKYSSEDGEIINVINRLKQLSPTDLANTIVCYREKSSSLMLAELLEREGIPFNIISGYSPFSHELYKHMVNILDLLYMPYDRECQLNLYKVLPIGKEEVQKAVGYNARKKKFNTDLDRKHFKDLDFGKYNNSLPFLKSLLKLTEMSQAIDTKPMNNYFSELFDMFKSYYWNWKKTQNDNEQVDSYFENSIMTMFNCNSTYKEFSNDYAKRRDLFRRNQFSREGVTLSTFHGLKGLEYDNVIIINLDDDIFPNYGLIDSFGYSEDMTTRLKESETRLFFVAMTRARKNLYLYYNENNPSIYIKWLLKWEDNKVDSNKGYDLTKLNVFDVPSSTEQETKYTDNNGDDEDDYNSIELEPDMEIEVEPAPTDTSIESMLESASTITDEDNSFVTKTNKTKSEDSSNTPKFSANSFLDSILSKL